MKEKKKTVLKLKGDGTDHNAQEPASIKSLNDSLNKKFPYIVAWGRYMGSYMYYINGQCRVAERTDAPTNAIYRDVGGKWYTIESCLPETRARVETFLTKEK